MARGRLGKIMLNKKYWYCLKYVTRSRALHFNSSSPSTNRTQFRLSRLAGVRDRVGTKVTCISRLDAPTSGVLPLALGGERSPSTSASVLWDKGISGRDFGRFLEGSKVRKIPKCPKALIVSYCRLIYLYVERP